MNKHILKKIVIATCIILINTQNFCESMSDRKKIIDVGGHCEQGIRYTNILCMEKKLADTLDEIRWSIGEVILSDTVLTNSGLYILGKSLEDESIVIEADSVAVDLNGYTVYDTTGTGTPIAINDGQYDITIKNGSLKGVGKDTSSSSGLVINEGASMVRVEDVRISDFNIGIHLDGSASDNIKACKFNKCYLFENNKGISLNYAIKCVFEDCTVYNSALRGFELLNSELNHFYLCKALETTTEDPTEIVAGFSSGSGSGNIFTECLANAMTKEGNFCGINIIGFYLHAGEKESEIVNCIANESIISGTSGTAYGILLNFLTTETTTWEDDIFAIASTKWEAKPSANIVDWYPGNINYIAVGYDYVPSSSQLRIYNYDCGLSFFTSARPEDELFPETLPNNGDIMSLAWRPDGEYLAVGIKITYGWELYVFKFDPSLATPLTLVAADTIVLRSLNCLTWDSTGNYLAGGTGDQDTPIVYPQTATTPIGTIYIWSFDDTTDTLTRTTDPATNPNAQIGATNINCINFSPDNNYIAIVFDNLTGVNLEIFSVAAGVIGAPAVSQIINGGVNLNSVHWNPQFSGPTYYLIVGGETSTGGTFVGSNLLALSYAGGGAVTELEGDPSLAPTNCVRFSPNGEYVLSCGDTTDGNAIEIFKFDPTASNPDILVSQNTSIFPGGNAKAGDWSPDGKNIVVVGENVDTAVYASGISDTSKCIVKNNEATNCTGGIGGVGIEGSSSKNLIIRNITYGNDTNFGFGVSNIYTDRLTGTTISDIINIAITDYQN